MEAPLRRALRVIRSHDWPTLCYLVGSALVLAYAFAAAFEVYAYNFERPIVGPHDFRQSQTALTVLTITQGGPWIRYETPLFGAPYTLPFEFPLYQWVVAAVHRGGVPLDQAGRYVSIGFFLLALLPLFRLLKSFDFSLGARFLTIAVLVSAPLYMYWTRAFMIESTALCLSLAALAVGVEGLDAMKSRRRLLLLLVFGSLAMLVKITTGVVYLGILGLLLVGRFAADEDRSATWKQYAVFALHALIVPTLIGLAWTQYAEFLKGQNALTADFLTSKPLHDWYYGTWQQKTALSTWVKLWDRTAFYGFGTAASPAAGLALAAFGTRRPWPLAACFVAVIGAFAVFTNLHDFHDYYQYATTLLVVVMVGFGFAAAESWLPRGRLLLPLLGAAIVLKSIDGYELDYRNRQGGDESVVEVGNFVKANTREEGLIVVHGDDWSSLLPYYSRRRAVMNRWNYPANHPALRLTLERSAAAGNKVEAVVFCHGDRGSGDGRAAALLGHAPTCTRFPTCDVCR